jgi:hypothetical protein
MLTRPRSEPTLTLQALRYLRAARAQARRSLVRSRQNQVPIDRQNQNQVRIGCPHRSHSIR